MAIDLYQLSVGTFQRQLHNLDAIIKKAAQHCEARKIDPSALMQARLFPDMFAFIRQVQLVSDFAKGAGARLSQTENPRFEDDESSFDELRARVAKTLAFLHSLDRAAFEGAAERVVDVPIGGGKTLPMPGANYLQHVALPNFYFHYTTAYGILRHNGVELGKNDFIGGA